jgi:hypothetical protein
MIICCTEGSPAVSPLAIPRSRSYFSGRNSPTIRYSRKRIDTSLNQLHRARVDGRNLTSVGRPHWRSRWQVRRLETSCRRAALQHAIKKTDRQLLARRTSCMTQYAWDCRSSGT